MFWTLTVIFFIEFLFWAGFCVLSCMNTVERSHLDRNMSDSSDEKDHKKDKSKDKLSKTNTTAMVAPGVPSEQDLTQN